MGKRLRLDWSDEAIANLEQLTDYLSSASEKAERDIRRMASSGFNYGRSVRSEPGVWYFPGKVGVYYEATPTTLRVIRVVDARRLRNLP